MMFGISPGPTEANHEGLQNFSVEYIDDLVNLFEDGIIIKTRRYPLGKVQVLYMI